MFTKENGFALPFSFKFPDAGKYAFTFLTLFVLLLAIYSNSFYGDWIFDDAYNIVNNPNIQIQTLSWQEIKLLLSGLHQGGPLPRPLPYLSFAVNYAMGGMNVFGFHVLNFLIHYLASVFLFLFIYNTLKLPRLRDQYQNIAYPVALLATFFWAIHPVFVTSVTYIVQRMASMAGMFYILSMYLYLKTRTSEKTFSSICFFTACALAGFAAVLSKENAVMLPVSLIFFELFLIQGISKESIKRFAKILIFPVLLILIIGWIYTGGFSQVFDGYERRDFTLIQRLLTEPRVILFYLSLLFYPISSRLTLLYDIDISTSLISPWTTLPAILLLTAIIAVALYLSRKRPLISFCILFFFLNHLVEGSFIPLELIYEHRNYLPAMLLFIPVAQFIIYMIDYFSYKKIISLIVACSMVILIFGLGDITYRRNAIVSSEILLSLDNIAKYPGLSRPYTILGTAYLHYQKKAEGLQCFQKALAVNKFSNTDQRAVQEHNLGVYYFKEEQFDLAFSYFEKAYQTIPAYLPNTVNMAKVYLIKDDIQAARRLLNPFIKKYSRDYALNEIFTLILLKENDLAAAESYAKNFLRHSSSAKFPYSVLAEVSRRRGNIRAAILYWEFYQERAPQDVSANLALIDLYAQAGESAKLMREVNKLYYLKGNRTISSYLEDLSRRKKLFVYFPDTGRIEAISRTKLICQ